MFSLYSSKKSDSDCQSQCSIQDQEEIIHSPAPSECLEPLIEVDSEVLDNSFAQDSLVQDIDTTMSDVEQFVEDELIFEKEKPKAKAAVKKSKKNKKGDKTVELEIVLKKRSKKNSKKDSKKGKKVKTGKKAVKLGQYQVCIRITRSMTRKGVAKLVV